LIFVNDGSSDGSGPILDALAARPCVRVLHLSRNFGQQAAVHAGLLHAAGDAIIVMDSDLQDDPETILSFLEKWEAGYDVVYAVRFHRKENAVKRSLFFAFYRMLHLISDTPIPKDAGNFGLIDRRAARQIAHLVDRDRYYPGLRRWVGFRQTGIPVERKARHDDFPRVSLAQLFRLAKTAIFSFSTFPLTMFYGIAGMSILVCAGLCGFTLYHKLVSGLAVPGWTSITIAASFFGALNALGIGILGEYMARIYDQVRARPLFIVDRAAGFGGAPSAAAFDRRSSPMSNDQAPMTNEMAAMRLRN
jgi:dolichol-phosphate mannosyltransferase